MEILHFEDLSANAVVLVLGGYQISIAIYPHIDFERDPLNIFRVRALTSSGSTGGRGGGDAKTIISPNTSFGDIIINAINLFRMMSERETTEPNKNNKINNIYILLILVNMCFTHIPVVYNHHTIASINLK